MKTIIVVGKTDSIINLNKIGVPIHGKVQAILKIVNEEQDMEVRCLVNAGYLEIIKDDSQNEKTQNTPIVTPQIISKDKESSKKPDTNMPNPESSVATKKGRPKGSKNNIKESKIKEIQKVKNSLTERELERVSNAEAETQKMGSRVIIGTLDGAKESKMKHSAIDDIMDSEQTRASLDAMAKLQKEEDEDISLPDTKIDDANFDASEQMGRKAVVANEGGINKVDMVNSIIPESKAIKEVDPFIDRKDKEEIMFIEEKQENTESDADDSFIEI